MKYIVIGLGNFGSSIAMELTDMNHDVIGVDSNMLKVEQYKNEITSTVCLNCMDPQAIASLPLDDADAVMVCIGEDFGASIMTTAILRQKNVKRLICRATSVLHESVLHSLGIEDIVFPEQETAIRLAKRLQLKGVVDSYKADEGHYIIKSFLPPIYHGLSIKEINLTSFNLIFIAVLEIKNIKNIFGERVEKYFVNPNKKNPNDVLGPKDVIMLYGNKNDIGRFFGI